MEKEIIKSKPRYQDLAIVAIGSVGSFIGSYFTINNAFSQEYPQLFGIIFGLILIAVGILCVYSIYNQNLYVLEHDRLKVFSLFGNLKKTIFISEITSYTKVKRKNKYTKWTDLTIFTRKHKLKISSRNFDDFKSFQKKLIKGISRDKESERSSQRKINRYTAVFISVMGLILLYFGVRGYIDRNEVLTSDEIITVEGKITSEIKITTDRKRKRPRIEISLAEFPDFEFILVSTAYEASYIEDFILIVKKGDNISLDIKKEVYSKKISKETELTFWEKTAYSNRLNVYGLRSNERTFLTLKDYNDKSKNDNEYIWLFIIGLLITLVGFIVIYNTTRKIKITIT